MCISSYYLSDSLEIESVIYAVKNAVKEYGVPAIINSDLLWSLPVSHWEFLVMSFQNLRQRNLRTVCLQNRGN